MISEPLSENERRYACPPSQFARHMAWLVNKDFTLLSLDEVLHLLMNGKSAPDRAVAVTLDDGHQDNYEHAFPILDQYKIPATIFLATGVLGDTNRWMHQQGFPRRNMLTWAQVGEMSRAGICFGGHTVNHPRLPELSPDEAHREIRDSKDEIENELGLPVQHFAYPYGLFNEAHVSSVRESGYLTACSTRCGFNNETTDPFILRRIEVYGSDPCWRLSQKLTFGVNDTSALLPARYYLGRLKARVG